MKKVIALLLIASVCSVANAVWTITETENFSGIAGGDFHLVFDQFDSNLGTLVGVEITFELYKTSITFKADNDATTASDVTFSQGVSASLDSEDVYLDNGGPDYISVVDDLDVLTSITHNIGATSGDSTSAFNETGDTDYFEWETGVASLSDSGKITDNDSLFNNPRGGTGYIGEGTYTLDLVSDQINTFTGEGLFLATGPSSINGSVSVRYEYEPVPEPATMALLGLGGLFIKRRKA